MHHSFSCSRVSLGLEVRMFLLYIHLDVSLFPVFCCAELYGVTFVFYNPRVDRWGNEKKHLCTLGC